MIMISIILIIYIEVMIGTQETRAVTNLVTGVITAVA